MMSIPSSNLPEPWYGPVGMLFCSIIMLRLYLSVHACVRPSVTGGQRKRFVLSGGRAICGVLQRA